MPPTTSSSDYTLEETSYPADTRISTATIAGVETVCTKVSFSDKILLTISQEGRLAYWITTPLSTSPTASDPTLSSITPGDSSTSHLPPLHLTASPLLGTPPPTFGTFAQTLATKTGGLILEMTQNAETRSLILGIGLAKDALKELDSPQGGSAVFGDLVGLVLGVL